MVLSDKYAGKPKPNLFKRTLIYVLSFGLGALVIVAILSFTMVAIADGLLPSANATAKPKTPRPTTSAADAAAPPRSPAARIPAPVKKPASKARQRRANEASEKPKPRTGQPL